MLRDSVREPLVSATLRGVELRLAFAAGGQTAELAGTVRGSEITGTLSPRAAARTAVGRLRGTLRPARRADVLPGCNGYYAR